MERCLRQCGFVFYSFVLQWPVMAMIWLLGRFGIFKTLFLIYPTDRSECLDFSPDISWLRKFFSGRPTPAGLIMDGWRPVGIYLVVPDTALELVRRKNRPMVEKIVSRMLWYRKLAGARTIGLAGQLGPIFEKQLGKPMEHPFYASTFGNIFSIHSAVNYIAAAEGKKPWQVSVGIIGGGELGESLSASLIKGGYSTEMVGVRYTRKGSVRLTDETKADQQLAKVDFAVNLLPRGEDFLGCDLHHKMRAEATVIDFSRPPLTDGCLPQKVVKGNRVMSGSIHFFVTLPGGWQHHELPACSMPTLLASLGNFRCKSLEEFWAAGRKMAFTTALAYQPAADNSPVQVPVTASSPLPGEL